MTASFQCLMSTSASFTYQSAPQKIVSGSFHDVSNGKFYILENCGKNCHILFAYDNSHWNTAGALSTEDTITAELIGSNEAEPTLKKTKVAKDLENQVEQKRVLLNEL